MCGSPGTRGFVLGVATILVVLAGSAGGPPARAQGLHEDFDGTVLDPAKWNLDQGDGSFVLAGGHATLSCPEGGDFPYLTAAVDPFPPTGDFLVRVGFRYPHVLSGGNGFGAEFVQRGFGAWQDSQGFLRVAVGDLYPVPLSTSIDTGPHLFEWQCISTTWSFWLDGVLIASDESSYRPHSLFFGHPAEPHPWWTTQEIDFVHIEGWNPVPVSPSSWGRVKALFRP